MGTNVKLKDTDLAVLRLIVQSPDRGDGWRSVSSVCWPLIERFHRDELIESMASDDGGGVVRLTDRGSILMDYI